MGKHRWPRPSLRPVVALLVILTMGFGAMVWAAMNEPVVAGTPETTDPNQIPNLDGRPAPIELGPTSVIVTPSPAPAGPTGTPGPVTTGSPVVTITLAPGGTVPGQPTGGSSPRTTPPRQTPPVLPTPGPTPPNAPTGPVAGDFAITEQWVTGFTAGIQLANQSTAGQHWQVSIVFSDNVKNLTNTWISGGNDTATMTRSGQTVVFRSINPLAGNQTIGLYFQFNKEGEDFTPSSCKVNNRDCA